MPSAIVTPIRQCCTGKAYAEKCGHCRADAMEAAREKQVIELLGGTRHGDCRPLYRNMASGNPSFPVLSPMEIAAKTRAQCPACGSRAAPCECMEEAIS